MGKLEVMRERSIEDRLLDAEVLVKQREKAISDLVAEYRQKQQDWGLVDSGAEVWFTGKDLAHGDVVRNWVRNWRANINQAQSAFHAALREWSGLKQELARG